MKFRHGNDKRCSYNVEFEFFFWIWYGNVNICCYILLKNAYFWRVISRKLRHINEKFELHVVATYFFVHYQKHEHDKWVKAFKKSKTANPFARVSHESRMRMPIPTRSVAWYPLNRHWTVRLIYNPVGNDRAVYDLFRYDWISKIVCLISNYTGQV